MIEHEPVLLICSKADTSVEVVWDIWDIVQF